MEHPTNDTTGEPAFVYETDIATTPERLWAALTSGELSRRYWFDRRIESDWTVGSPVRFYDGGTDTVTDSGVVLAYDPPRRLAYTFRQESEDGQPETPPTRVTFTVEPLDGDRVRMRLVHDQLVRPDDVAGWRQGWSPILANLQSFLEGRPATAEPPAAAVPATSEAAEPSLRRRLAASPAAVFGALTDPEQVRQWWQPKGWTTTVRELDAREGGTFAITNTMPDGTPVELRGTYREVVADRRVSHTLRALGDPRESLVTFDLRPDGEGTILTLTEVGAGHTEADLEGWREGLDQLETLVTRADRH